MCGRMKDRLVESRLSRLVSAYKATYPYTTRDQCAAYVQNRGQLCTVLKLAEREKGLKGKYNFYKMFLRCRIAQLSFEQIREKS